MFTLTKGHNLGITYVTGVSKDDEIIDIEPDVDGFAYATGSRSVHLACELNAKEIYIVGHDLYSDTDKVNNIYAGTNSYAEKDALAARPDNQMKHLVGSYNIETHLINFLTHNSIK